jgi:hypothetical protein
MAGEEHSSLVTDTLSVSVMDEDIRHEGENIGHGFKEV